MESRNLILKGDRVNKLRNKNQKGFTLIELLVVISIIGLLASVVLLALTSARAKSRDAKRIADIRQTVSALELHFNDANQYPATLASLVTIANSGGQVYLGAVPIPPQPTDGTGCTAYTQYTYTPSTPAPSTSYTLRFCLGATTGGLGPATRTASPTGIQ